MAVEAVTGIDTSSSIVTLTAILQHINYFKINNQLAEGDSNQQQYKHNSAEQWQLHCVIGNDSKQKLYLLTGLDSKQQW